MWIAKHVIALFIFVIGIQIVADMEVTWKHLKDG
jgi:hypothetical protein